MHAVRDSAGVMDGFRAPFRGAWCLLAWLCLLPGLALAADAGWSGLAESVKNAEHLGPGFRAAVERFYRQRGNRPLWYRGSNPAVQTGQLLDGLEKAGDEGLNPADYQPARLREQCAHAVPGSPLACELRLTQALLAYAQDVGYGAQRPQDMDANWHIPAEPFPVTTLLRQAAAADELSGLLRQLPPPHEDYKRLRDALRVLRMQVAAGGWPTLPEGPTLRMGMRADRVAILRDRLAWLDPELAEVSERADFDAELAAAVERFQARHGLEVDGIVGSHTRAALNVPLADRIVQLRVNMERLRWLPRDLGETHILVNLPAFELTLTHPDLAIKHMRIITGRRDRTSPSFMGRINQVVVNPDWTVPRRIAVEELLPQLQRDPRALEPRGIRVLQRMDGILSEIDPVSVRWDGYSKDNFPFILRQDPGPQNALGQLKFGMPNPFSIFMHGTPTMGLFNNHVRTFSHGCIRVEQPVRLAARLLGNDPAAIEAQIQELIAQGETGSIPVEPPVPVYLVYLTAWVDDQGNLQFRDDVYGRNISLQANFSDL